MKLIAAAIAFFLVSTISASAQNGAPALKILLCKTIEDGPARLKCYDEAIAALVSTPTKPADPPKETAWTITEDKSPIDDTPNVIGVLRASDSNGAFMAIRCKEHQTEVYFGFPSYLGSSRMIRVIYRINDTKAIETRWSSSSDGRATFVVGAIPFIRKIEKDSTIFVRAFDFQGSQSEATFKVGDVGDLRSKVALLCKWPEATVDTSSQKVTPQLKLKPNSAAARRDPLKLN